MTKIIKNIFLIAISLTFFSTTAIYASPINTPNTVMFANQKLNNVAGINTLTLDVIGLNFTAPLDGAAFSLSWDALILNYTSFTADASWDIAFVDETNVSLGSLDNIFLARSVGETGANFILGTLAFDILDLTQLSIIRLGDDSFGVGFNTTNGESLIKTNYLDAQIVKVTEPNQWILIIVGLSIMYFLINRQKYRRVYLSV
jgi:hypothetical protein